MSWYFMFRERERERERFNDSDRIQAQIQSDNTTAQVQKFTLGQNSAIDFLIFILFV